jgi:ubiquitin carboxyl-terminal hydrolase 5/13
MNIKLTPKEVDQSTGALKPQQVTKLAIGKPGGVDAETDKYDTSVFVFCRECQAELPLAKPRVASLVDSVLLANSAYNQSAIGEWENELISCHHIKNLD